MLLLIQNDIYRENGKGKMLLLVVTGKNTADERREWVGVSPNGRRSVGKKGKERDSDMINDI